MWEYKLLFMEKGVGDIMIAPKCECGYSISIGREDCADCGKLIPQNLSGFATCVADPSDSSDYVGSSIEKGKLVKYLLCQSSETGKYFYRVALSTWLNGKYECITTRLFNERFAKIGSGKEYNIKNKEIISNVDVRTNIFKK